VTQGRILYFQYTNPAGYPPLEHSSRILGDRGWQILFLGTGARGADALEFPPHPNITVHRWKFQSPGIRQKLHFLGFNLEVLLTAIRLQPNWVYASDVLACPAAMLLKALGFRVLYHEHDSPVGAGLMSDIRHQMSLFQRFLMWTRKKLAQCADLCVLPNEKRIERFQEATGRQGPTFCVWNCPMREEAEVEPRKSTDDFIVFYHGSLVPSRLPLTVIDALVLLPDWIRLEFAGYETVGYPGYVSQLLQQAIRNDVRDRVKYLGVIPRRDALLGACRRAHVGIALMSLVGNDFNERTMTQASNKPFDYMACAATILVSDLPDWRTLFVESDYALFCDPVDPTSIAMALRWFGEHKKQTREMGERGRRRIQQEWNYETQFEPVLRILTER
jgi:glycosyltransferase involved in cell wall biosynthesis